MFQEETKKAVQPLIRTDGRLKASGCEEDSEVWVDQGGLVHKDGNDNDNDKG